LFYDIKKLKMSTVHLKEDFEEFEKQFIKELKEVFLYFFENRGITTRELIKFTGMHTNAANNFIHGDRGFDSIEELTKVFYTCGMTVEEAIEQKNPFPLIDEFNVSIDEDNEIEKFGSADGNESRDEFIDDMY